MDCLLWKLLHLVITEPFRGERRCSSAILTKGDPDTPPACFWLPPTTALLGIPVPSPGPLSCPPHVSVSVCFPWAIAPNTLQLYPEPAGDSNHHSFTKLLSFPASCSYFTFYFLFWLSFVHLPPLLPRNGDHVPSTSTHRISSR